LRLGRVDLRPDDRLIVVVSRDTPSPITAAHRAAQAGVV